MISITIFGSGTMGDAIGQLLTRGGSTVHHVARDDHATISDDIVVLAVPYESLESIAEKYGKQLACRTVVDITNPLRHLRLPEDARRQLRGGRPASRAAGRAGGQGL